MTKPLAALDLPRRVYIWADGDQTRIDALTDAVISCWRPFMIDVDSHDQFHAKSPPGPDPSA
jgi:hypothetical protein